MDGKADVVATCSRGVRVMSLGFFGLFAGFGATQSLQSSVNGNLGQINLACLYFVFVIFGFLCPPMVSGSIKRFGWRGTLIVAGCTYIAMILSNLDTGRSAWGVQPVMNMVLGAGAAFLWTTQNFYFGQCAAKCGEATAGKAGVADAVSAMATRFNSSFFAVFQFSNMAGNLVSSGLMLAFANVSWMRTLLFVVLTAVAVIGCATFMILPSLESQESSEEAPSPMAALRSIVDVRYALLLPWIIANGMTFGFINADFNSDLTSPLLGSSYVGIIMVVFFATDAVMTILWGKLISAQSLSRRIVFVIATAFWLLFIVLKMTWTRAPNFESVNGKWTKIPGQEIEAQDVVLPVVLAMIAACGDAFWTPGPPQILQSFFAGSNLLSTMAAYKALQSLGFAIQFILGAILHDQVGVRNGILLCVIVLGFVSVMFLDLFKQRLDVQNQAISTEPLQENA